MMFLQNTIITRRRNESAFAKSKDNFLLYPRDQNDRWGARRRRGARFSFRVTACGEYELKLLYCYLASGIGFYFFTHGSDLLGRWFSLLLHQCGFFGTVWSWARCRCNGAVRTQGPIHADEVSSRGKQTTHTTRLSGCCFWVQGR